MQQIRASRNDVYMMQVVNKGLSPYDDKRYVLKDEVSTLAFGHKKIGSLN